jgi:hypothetical protein
MCDTSIIQFDPGEPPNSMRYEQAERLGLIPSVNADGVPDIFHDTGTTVSGFNKASIQVAELLQHAD